MNCQRMEEQLTLYFYDELPAEERGQVEAHLAACGACAAKAEEWRKLGAVLDHRPKLEPSPEFLVQCRWDLDEALDREERSWQGLLRGAWGLGPMGSPVGLTAVLAILLVGVSLGWTLRQQVNPPVVAPNGQANQWLGADLSDLRISGISQVAPDPQTGRVRISLDAERRVNMEGSLDDPRIRQVLVYAMKSYQNPGIRHDTLELLRTRGEDPTVREALLYAVRNDPNDGVRLEALNAVQGLAWTPEVRMTILDTLENDTNPGVRIAAINTLLERADEQGFPEFLPTLEKLAVHDKNPYVRLKCSKAIRELPSDEF